MRKPTKTEPAGELVSLTVRLPVELLRKLEARKYAIGRGATFQGIVAEALTLYFKKQS